MNLSNNGMFELVWHFIFRHHVWLIVKCIIINERAYFTNDFECGCIAEAQNVTYNKNEYSTLLNDKIRDKHKITKEW